MEDNTYTGSQEIPTQIDVALAAYESALAGIIASKLPPDPKQVVRVLMARDAVQAALAGPIQHSDEEAMGVQKIPPPLPHTSEPRKSHEWSLESAQVTRLIELDRCLLQEAMKMDQAINLRRLGSSLNRPVTAWWWHLKDYDSTPLLFGNGVSWIWSGLAILCLISSFSIMGSIAPRFLAGGPDILGSSIISTQGILTLLVSKSLITEIGRRHAKDIFSSFASKRYWRRVLTPCCILLFLLSLWLMQSIPAIAASYIRNGTRHFKAGQWSSAKTNYERALKLDPDSAEAHFHLGVIYDQLHDFSMARQQYQLALQGQGKSEFYSDAYNNLARQYILADKPAVAVSILKALELQLPKKANEQLLYSLNKNLGWARLKQGRLAEAEAKLYDAIESAQKAHLEKGRSAAAHCLLAQVLDKQRNPKQAQPEWQSCLQSYGLLPEEDEWIGMAHKRLTTSGGTRKSG